jgi:mRNA interferase RelE/StbE
VTYNVLLERQAEKELRNLPEKILKRIDKRLQSLAEEPWPGGVKKLKGKESEGWRIKSGEYRILYTVDKTRKVVQVYRIKHRREAYR